MGYTSKIKYSRKFQDLSKNDLYVIALSLGVPKENASQCGTKTELINLIVEKNDTFRNETDIYYFHIETEETTLSDRCSLQIASDINTSDYQYKFNQHKNLLKDTAANTDVSPSIDHSNSVDLVYGEDEASEHQEQAQLKKDDQDRLQYLDFLKSNSSRTRPKNFKVKIEYDEARGIEEFLANIETYERSYNVVEKQEWVKDAILVLSSHKKGMMIKESLSQQEMSNWSLFKEKLISLLGRSRDHYIDQYRKFRREKGESCGMAFARLVFMYKMAFKARDLPLTESDETQIKSTFISSLEKPLKGIVKSEAHLLSFNQIARRTQELEEAHDLSPEIIRHDADIYAINAVTALHTPESRDPMLQMIKDMQRQMQMAEQRQMDFQRQQAEIQRQMVEMVRSMRSPMPAYDNAPPRRKGFLSRLDMGKLDGFCAYFIKFGNCKRADCKYKHTSPVPESIRQMVNDA